MVCDVVRVVVVVCDVVCEVDVVAELVAVVVVGDVVSVEVLVCDVVGDVVVETEVVALVVVVSDVVCVVVVGVVNGRHVSSLICSYPDRQPLEITLSSAFVQVTSTAFGMLLQRLQTESWKWLLIR